MGLVWKQDIEDLQQLKVVQVSLAAIECSPSVDFFFLFLFFLCLNFKPTETQVLAFLTTEHAPKCLPLLLHYPNHYWQRSCWPAIPKKTPQINVETDRFCSHFSLHYSQDKTTLLGQTHTTVDTQSWDKKSLPFGCQHSKRNVYS